MLQTKKNKKTKNVTFKCNRQNYIAVQSIYYMVILWTAPSLSTKGKETNNTKHHKQSRFKIDSVWLQVALSVCSRPEAPTIINNKERGDKSMDHQFLLLFHSFKSLVFCMCESGEPSVAFESWRQARADNTGEQRNAGLKRRNSCLPNYEHILA